MKTVKITDKDLYTEDEVYWAFYRCPNCSETNIASHFQYCPHCGIKIIWEITEDPE